MRALISRLLTIASLVSMFFLAFAPTQAGSEDKKNVTPGNSEYGLAAGQKMPFHVVDFVSGPRKGGGCPSIMINNARTRGVVLWSRTLDDKVLLLAKRIQAPLGKYPNAQGYLAVYDKQDDLADLAQKNALNLFSVGIMRKASQEEMEKRAGVAEADLAVFLLDHKMIKAAWLLKSKDLDKQKSDMIVRTAENHFSTKEEEKKP